MGLRSLIRRIRPLQGGDEERTREGEDNVDAMSTGSASGKGGQAGGASLGSNVPPNYIKSYDEGRPPH
jgi:hypothetical protein